MRRNLFYAKTAGNLSCPIGHTLQSFTVAVCRKAHTIVFQGNLVITQEVRHIEVNFCCLGVLQNICHGFLE